MSTVPTRVLFAHAAAGACRPRARGHRGLAHTLAGHLSSGADDWSRAAGFAEKNNVGNERPPLTKLQPEQCGGAVLFARRRSRLRPEA
ncbi:hypothetical protein EVAR_535_1 [Eumeta japonica]|uniref:Uncharacterized protein n=1 Tax=Eumeta variegata TaxID=151549 RepID=A0A4C1SAQ9_EUMVA|nr:hypothetical protein EVAR_535_1 [Eumeta japonica]